MTREERLIEIARSYLGVHEAGDNAGPQVEEFQKAIDGRALREPWCLAFLQFCVKKTDAELGTATCFFPTEHVLTLWNKTPKEARISKPEPGCAIVWQMWKDGKPTSSGHVGLVVEVLNEKVVHTIEGNTSSGGAEIDRDGDGVFLRARFTSTLSSSSRMRVLGFLRAWI